MLMKTLSHPSALLSFVLLASCSSVDDGAESLTQPSPAGNVPVLPDGTSGNATAGSDADDAPLEEAAFPASRSERALTWRAALVRLPDGNGGVVTTTVDALETGVAGSDGRLPVVVFLHGCSGFWEGTRFRLDWLAGQGFAVIAPDSFARSFYPTSCDLQTRRGWLYEPTLSMRRFDAAFALEQVRDMDWVDPDGVFLYGFSEGGAAAATFVSNRTDQVLAGRVIESWNCHSVPWQSERGLRAPEAEPVLSLFSDQDPWLQGGALPGTCGDFMSTTNGSLPITIDYAPLRTQHPLLEAPEIREIVLDFLLQQRGKRPRQPAP